MVSPSGESLLFIEGGRSTTGTQGGLTKIDYFVLIRSRYACTSCTHVIVPVDSAARVPRIVASTANTFAVVRGATPRCPAWGRAVAAMTNARQTKVNIAGILCFTERDAILAPPSAQSVLDSIGTFQ